MPALQLAFTTDAVHPRERFDLWHEAACRNYARHECTPQSMSSFAGSLRVAQLAQAELSVYDNAAMQLWRTPRQVERAPADRVFVCLQLENSCRISQLGRETTIFPGQYCFVHTNRPYSFAYPERSRQLVLNIAAQELERRLGPTANLTALAIKPDAGINGIAIEFLQALPRHAMSLSETATSVVTTQALDLIALCFAEHAELEKVKLGSGAALTLVRLRCAIEEALTDPEAKCSDIAAKTGISVRYANALLSKQGTSLERLMQKRRLEKCREMLERHSDRSISEIAFAWGFSDVSHFCRTFKAAYGIAPRDYQRGERSESPQ
jgi:AraC-like DNA-binding protein